MGVIFTAAGYLILSRSGYKNSRVYQGIMEMLARFDYLSIEEVMYAFELPLMQAVHRLDYLENRCGLIKRFSSHTRPKDFFYLTAGGRQVVRDFQISDYVSEFVPSSYAIAYQAHRRAIIKSYAALKILFGDKLLNWKNERQLQALEEYRQRQEYGHQHKRILDGECSLMIRQDRFTRDPDGNLQPLREEALWVEWRTGVEVELTAKSPRRYEDQFNELRHLVYDRWDKKQICNLVIFFYSTRTIHDHLVREIQSGRHDFGNCLFYVVPIDAFLKNPAEAAVEVYVGENSRTITGKDMGAVRVLVTNGGAGV